MGSHGNNNRRKGPRELVTGGEWIYGRNPVEEALAAGRRSATEIVLPAAFPDEDDQIRRIRDEAHARRLVVRTMERDQLDRLTRFGHHQGVALKTSGYPYVDLVDIIQDAADDDNALVVVLDHLEDPQNVGSILRSAAAAGATGVVIPEDRASGITPAAVRASAGGAEHIKVAKVVNLPRAIQDLKDAGLWFTALDWGEDAKPYTKIDFKGKVGLVVGSEGSGITRLVRENCDFVAHIPMPGGFESLNAGVAAAITIFEVLRQRGEAL
jgi:23S rRNA (guanosine2251-2'-O)-methyltransferase